LNLLNDCKFLIQKTLRKLGWEIHRFSNGEMVCLSQQLTLRNIDNVIDVGANQGQFASSLFSAGYNGSITSFEPLLKPYEKLKKIAKKNYRWHIANRVAVGADLGVVEINISENLVSSSILPILKDHTLAAPSSKYVGKESISMITLDSFFNKTPMNRPFIKIDTQGYEMQVLKGCSNSLQNVSGVLVEVSIASLYDGQADYIALLSFIRDAGFDLWAVNPGFREPSTGRLLQFDALFFRR